MGDTSVNPPKIQSATSVGTNVTTGALNIGTGAAARTITVGNAASAAVNVNALTAAISTGATTLTTVAYDHNATGAVTIDASGSNAISIGSDTNTGIINVGNSNSARTINVGHAASTAVNVNALAATITSVNALSVTDGAANLAFDGSGATTFTTVAYDHNATGAITIDASGSNAISIGATSATGAINLGTTGARTITVGNTTAGTKVVVQGNTYLDDGATVRSGSPPPGSATIATFTAGEAVTAGHAVKASGQMTVAHAIDTDDNIIGILLTGGSTDAAVQVQVGGIMLAKYHSSAMDPSAGDIAKVSDATDSNKGTLVSAAAGAKSRFTVIAGGTAGTATTLVMWAKGEIL